MGWNFNLKLQIDVHLGQRDFKASNSTCFQINDLFSFKYESKLSNDIYMDPCKAGTAISGFVFLPKSVCAIIELSLPRS